MIAAGQIMPLRGRAQDEPETKVLKSRFAGVLAERRPFFLTKSDFERVLRWKLRGQYGRGAASRAIHTENVIREVTRAAFAVSSDDLEYELELRVGILTSLRGVAVPVASAALALTCPERYAVIDFRVWRQLFHNEKPTFTLGEYKKYMAAIHQLADELGWPPHEVDQAIWEYDRRRSGK
jgi:hypothetical protein